MSDENNVYKDQLGEAAGGIDPNRLPLPDEPLLPGIPLPPKDGSWSKQYNCPRCGAMNILDAYAPDKKCLACGTPLE